jgi:hypothetical protein
MAESKFANIFENSTVDETPAPGRIEKPAPALKTPGRPPGKRSDPDFKQYSVLLKRQTQRQASDILRNQENGQDLSDLVQQLLEQWLKKQSKA